LNAVEIEEAISDLAELAFDPAGFPYAFLEAFGNKSTTIKRLKSGSTNASDLEGGVLQRGNIHILTCEEGSVSSTLQVLKSSPSTSKAKVKFILATDGISLEAEDIVSGETVVSAYNDFPNHFGFFLPLAGISTVKQIRESSFDIRATSRLNRLYVELLRNNPDWGTSERRHDMNHFMARLIFCFFAEDTDIFNGDDVFTNTIDKMSDTDSSNTHEIISAIFSSMNTKGDERKSAGIRSWADGFPYVNGGLFSGNTEAPKFSKIARSYLLHVGALDWKQINPDIFGSMIQAVADDEERGSLGMHYTSVPNILKVLNPLFLDDLREQLEQADGNPRKLLNLRKRISTIRVFDPACGSGNFLVIAYKKMREIEAEINTRRGEAGRPTEIPLTNYRGIELRDFPAEIARLALIIAEYQCDLVYRGQKEALAEFLPLDSENWITCGNALRVDWLSVCPPTGTVVKLIGDDLFSTPLNQAQIDFENEGGQTYICGNPPFSGTRKQSAEQKNDLKSIFSDLTTKWKNVDYVGGWFLKAANYNKHCSAPFAFVATNSICQGQQVPITWSLLLGLGLSIRFAFAPFKWSNLASNKAGVTVVIVGMDNINGKDKFLYSEEEKAVVEHINPYLTSHKIEIIQSLRTPMSTNVQMEYGVYYSKSAGLILSPSEYREIISLGVPEEYFKKFIGSQEFIKGVLRYCLWLSDESLSGALSYLEVKNRIDQVRVDRLATGDKSVNKLAARSHQFREFKGDENTKIFIPIVSSEAREYFPAGLVSQDVIPTNKAFYSSNAPIWMISILVSKIHLVWIGTICGRLEMRYSYSNTLGWNTFPLPMLTERHKEDLTRCSKDILLAREEHFPATIADLYDPQSMPENLRRAHDRNDEVLERIYIGRRFKNDTERLEKLFDLHAKITVNSKKKDS